MKNDIIRVPCFTFRFRVFRFGVSFSYFKLPRENEINVKEFTHTESLKFNYSSERGE